MFRQNQPAPGLRIWRTPSALQLARNLEIRIRVCLQAYRKPRKIFSALAAEITKANSPQPSQILLRKRKAHSLPKNERTLAPRPLGQYLSLLRASEAAALIEFAVALPLIMVLVVGIFDFGSAFNLKQKLNNAAREGAGFGAAQPSNDLGRAQPPSVNAVRYLVASYLQTAHINDCGLSLSSTTWALAGGNLDWHFTATGNGCSMTLDVIRNVPVQQTVGGAPVNLLCTTVKISYPYRWQFNNVIQLLVPGANYTLGNIQSDATAVNMD
jgi:Flp pilus assembly protein TadG